MSVFLTGHETLIVLPDYPTEGTGDYGIGAPAYRLRAHGDGCAGYPSTAVATAAPLFCFHGISDCCDLGVDGALAGHTGLLRGLLPSCVSPFKTKRR